MQKLVNLKNQKLIADNKKARYNYFIEEEKYIKAASNGKIACPICKQLEQLHKQDLK